MNYFHVATVFGFIAIPSCFGPAVWPLLEWDFDGFYIDRRDVQMVAQLPGAFWVK